MHTYRWVSNGFTIDLFVDDVLRLTGNDLGVPLDTLWMGNPCANYNNPWTALDVDYVSLVLSDTSWFCACASGVSCAGTTTDSGCLHSGGVGARLSHAGSVSVTSDDLVLQATDVPVNQSGILFMGGGQNSGLSFGDGRLCVSPGPAAFCRFPVQNSGVSGTLSGGPGIVSLSQSFALDCRIDPGETWFFQAWFRDPTGPCGGFFNLSNGLAVTFAP